MLVNNVEAELNWPAEVSSRTLPIDQELYPLVSFPKGMQGCAEMQARSGIGISFAEQAVRKKLRHQVFQALAKGQMVVARLSFEAVEKGNLALLRTLAESTLGVNAQVSADVPYTPVEAAVVSNNLGLVHEFITTIVHNQAHCAAAFPPNSIAKEIDTGTPTAHTFNHRVGKIGAARGGKEGNGAFIAW